jgi:hypothetical protein
MHWMSTSNYTKLRPELSRVRFRLPSINHILLKYFLRPLVVVPTFLVGAYLICEFYKNARHDEDHLLEHDDWEIALTKLIVNLTIALQFAYIYFNVFLRQPNRYIEYNFQTRGSCWPWGWWRLKDEYKTHNVAHSKFDDLILAFALTLKIVIFIADCVECSYSSNCFMEQVVDATQVLAMMFEWFVLRNMSVICESELTEAWFSAFLYCIYPYSGSQSPRLVLNDSELMSSPLVVKSIGIGLGPLMTLNGTAVGFVMFFEEFIARCILQWELTIASRTQAINLAERIRQKFCELF